MILKVLARKLAAIIGFNSIDPKRRGLDQFIKEPKCYLLALRIEHHPKRLSVILINGGILIKSLIEKIMHVGLCYALTKQHILTNRLFATITNRFLQRRIAFYVCI